MRMHVRLHGMPYGQLNGALLQVEERTLTACKPENFYGPLTDREVAVSPVRDAYFFQCLSRGGDNG